MHITLPNLLDYAIDQGIAYQASTLNKDDVYCECPFCKEKDKSKFKLTINKQKNVFRCFICGKTGNTIYFMEWFEKKPRELIYKEMRQAAGIDEASYQKRMENKHPAERLTSAQLKLIHYVSRPVQIHQLPSEFKKKMNDQIWNEWSSYLIKMKRKALVHLMYCIQANHYTTGIEYIKTLSIELGEDITEEVLQAYSSGDTPPLWAEGAYHEVQQLFEMFKTIG